MCSPETRQVKLLKRLIQVVNDKKEFDTNFKEDHLVGVQDVKKDIKSNVDLNLDRAEIKIQDYEKDVALTKALRQMRKEEEEREEAIRLARAATEQFRQAAIGGEVRKPEDYTVSAPSTLSTLLYYNLSGTGQDRILAQHNEFRGWFRQYDDEVRVLEWSDELAKRAARWALKLATLNKGLVHSNSTDDKYLGGKLPYEVPENLCGGPGLSYVRTPEYAVTDWFSEINLTSYGTKNPTENKVNHIGHFMTIVSRSVDAVGGGMAKTTNGSEVWVCHYRVRSPQVFKPASGADYIDWGRITRTAWDSIKGIWKNTLAYKAHHEEEQSHMKK
jgi:hypothetical protein